MFGFIGPNGAGKTTTFYMMVGLIEPDEGRVVLGERDVTTSPMFRRARMGIAYLAQRRNVFPHLTVRQNVTLAPIQVRKWSKAKAEEIGTQLLERVGIPEQAEKYPNQLSGGQCDETPELAA